LISRHEAISIILGNTGQDDLVLSTTGMISREVFSSCDRPGNFYMIGSMGLLSAFGLGLALLRPDLRILALDGDGSALMSLGTLPLISSEAPANLLHIILDNEAYESTGSQPSISSRISLAEIGRASGYQSSIQVEDGCVLEQALQACSDVHGPHLILVKAGIASSGDVPRVSRTPMNIRDRFKAHIEGLTPECIR